MAEFRILLSNNAEKGLGNSDSLVKKRLCKALDSLEINPVPVQEFDVIKLSCSESNYRIRVGRYRVLYSIDWKSKPIFVFDICKRKDSTYN